MKEKHLYIYGLWICAITAVILMLAFKQKERDYNTAVSSNRIVAENVITKQDSIAARLNYAIGVRDALNTMIVFNQRPTNSRELFVEIAKTTSLLVCIKLHVEPDSTWSKP